MPKVSLHLHLTSNFAERREGKVMKKLFLYFWVISVFSFGTAFAGSLFDEGDVKIIAHGIGHGSINNIKVNNSHNIKVDYSQKPAVVYINGKEIWMGEGAEIECISTVRRVVVKIDTKTIFEIHMASPVAR